MKIAANPKSIDSFGYQIIFNEEFKAIGINFVYDKQILKKERFKHPVRIASEQDEYKLAQNIICKLFKR
jgi:hypothetical protein